jgi:hypothetical protein
MAGELPGQAAFEDVPDLPAEGLVLGAEATPRQVTESSRRSLPWPPMELVLDRVEVVARAGDREVRGVVPLRAGEPVAVGPLEVVVDLDGWPATAGWTVANRSSAPVAVRSVALVGRLHGVEGPLRLLRHGYQSWSETSVATLGVDQDPSQAEGSIRLVRGMHHADEEVAAAGELRSELVTVLAGAGRLLLVGFDGGHRHDGTIRVRPTPEGPEVRIEAFLGGAHLNHGEHRRLHRVVIDEGVEPAELLEGWAGRVGSAAAARISAPYQVGWCSWYHYFHGVTEADLRANLARADDWPFDVFQLDDGFQPAIGDWLTTPSGFRRDSTRIAADIASAGRASPASGSPRSWPPPTRGGHRAPGLVVPATPATTNPCCRGGTRRGVGTTG